MCLILFHFPVTDANRFGTKMLEKMGWSKGKGLGTNEDGEQNFIRVSHKTDQKGVGYEDRDDQWTGHENLFNTLLESLNNSRNPSDEDGVEKSASGDDESDGARTGFGFAANDGKKSKKAKSIKSKLSGKSLEEMSKKSGVRVHYRKFTRGKDISKYSEKDLANIFGKKCVNGDIVEETNDEAPTTLNESVGVDYNYGITTIETGTSVQDYFKMKKRKKEMGDAGEGVAGSGGGGGEIINECAEKTDGCEKKRRKKDKQIKFEQNTIEPTENEPLDEIKTVEKKKKKKRSKQEPPAEVMETNAVSDEIVATKTKKKKRKDKKNAAVENAGECMESTPEDTTDAVDANVAEDVTETVSKKKKKKNRDKTSTSEVIPPIADTEEVNTLESKPINNTQFIDGILGLLVNHSPHSSTAPLKPANTEHDDSQSPPSSPSTKPAYTPATNIAMDRVFEINRYHAEMFRFVDLDGFPDSNLSELNGYGYSGDIELQISEKSKDQTKINDLWDCALVNKYGKDVIQTKKAKKSKQYSIGRLKKKNLFQKL